MASWGGYTCVKSVAEIKGMARNKNLFKLANKAHFPRMDYPIPYTTSLVLTDPSVHGFLVATDIDMYSAAKSLMKSPR